LIQFGHENTTFRAQILYQYDSLFGSYQSGLFKHLNIAGNGLQ
jgi:hypothetical protein